MKLKNYESEQILFDVTYLSRFYTANIRDGLSPYQVTRLKI